MFSKADYFKRQERGRAIRSGEATSWCALQRLEEEQDWFKTGRWFILHSALVGAGESVTL